jgi:hypothetical protein
VLIVIKRQKTAAREEKPEPNSMTTGPVRFGFRSFEFGACLEFGACDLGF